MNKYMQIALEEAKKALKRDEVPVGAVIVKNNKIISKGYNQKEKTHNVIKHAEIIAIEKACRKLKTWHLNDCDIYVTLEPCMMCCGAIQQSKIKRLYYAADSTKFGQVNNNHKVLSNIEVNSKIDEFESIQLLQKFFKSKRK